MQYVAHMKRQALSTRIAQVLSEPAEAILVFHTLITRHLSQDEASTAAPIDDGVLRHYLRTPVKAILGYSELMPDEAAGARGSVIVKHVRTIIKE